MDGLPHEPNGKENRCCCTEPVECVRDPQEGHEMSNWSHLLYFEVVRGPGNAGMMRQKYSLCFGVACLNFVLVAPAGYDDGSAPADHCSTAQGGQHQ